MGTNLFTAFLPYGQKWKIQRRMMHRTLGPDTVAIYETSQTRKVKGLL